MRRHPNGTEKFILKEFLPGEDLRLTDDLPLISAFSTRSPR
jgi:hypothetical protein